MSEISDLTAAVERLERRAAREKSARLQAEAIAEQVASDRWELRAQLEEKLALRTAELEAARRTASAAVSERERCLSTMSHSLRTSLTALFFLAESLSEGEPVEARQLQDLRNLLSEMQAAMDDAACMATTDGAKAGAGSARPIPLAQIVSAHEARWHQEAARSGRLLIVDVETPAGLVDADAGDDVGEQVLGLIRDRVESSEPVIELHLSVGPTGLQIR